MSTTTITRKAYQEMLDAGHSPDAIRKAASDKGYTIEGFESSYVAVSSVKQAPSGLDNFMGGLASAGTALVGGATKSVINSPLVNPLAAPTWALEKMGIPAKPSILRGAENKVDEAMRNTKWAISRDIAPDTESGMYLAGSMTAAAAPYVTGGGPLASAMSPTATRILSTLNSKNAPLAVVKYLSRNAVEAGAADASIAGIVGDNPLYQGVGGAVGGAVAGALSRGGVGQTLERASANSAMDDAIKTVARSAEDPQALGQVADEVMDAHSRLAVSHREISNSRISVGTETNSSALKTLEETLRQSGDTRLKFFGPDDEVNSAVQSGFVRNQIKGVGAGTKTVGQILDDTRDTLVQQYNAALADIYDRTGLTLATDYAGSPAMPGMNQRVRADFAAERGDAASRLRSVRAAYRESGGKTVFEGNGEKYVVSQNTRPGESQWRVTYLDDAETPIGHETFESLNDALKWTSERATPPGFDEAVIAKKVEALDNIPVTEEALQVWRDAFAKAQQKNGFDRFYEYAKFEGIEADLVESLSGGKQTTIGHLRRLSTKFLDKGLDMHDPTDAFMVDLRTGINNSMAATIRELAGDDAAKTFLATRKTIAKDLASFEQKAFAQIRDEVRDMDADKLVDYLTRTPGRVEELMSYLSKVEGNAENARRFMAARTLESALNKATSKGGFDSARFRDEAGRLLQTDSQGRSAAGLVWDQKLIDDMQDFMTLTDELNTSGGSPLSALRGASNAGRAQFAEAFAGAAAEQQQTSALIGRQGMIDRAMAIASSQINKFYKLAAIDRIGLSNEAQAYILSDPTVRPILLEAMRQYRNALKSPKGVPSFFDEAAAKKVGVQLKSFLARHHPRVFRRAFSEAVPNRAPIGAAVGGALTAGAMPQSNY